jgi:hypothetical protein
MEPDLTEEDKQLVYNWIDEIPLSRPKKNISRDFSDGVLLAEVIRHFLPKLVDLHNYSSFNSITQKRNNWETLNKKVLKRLGYQLTKADVENLVNCMPDMIERVLKNVKLKVESYKPKLEEPALSAEKKPVKAAMKVPTMQPSVDTDLLTEKEATIQELKETIEIMEVKIKKLEQLIRLKDNKIQALTNMLAQNGIADAPMS